MGDWIALPRADVDYTPGREPEITLVPGHNDAVYVQSGQAMFDPDTEVEDVRVVVSIPHLPTIIGPLDGMAELFASLGRRLELAREDYLTGHRNLGEVA